MEIFLQEIRKTTDAGVAMMTRRFHLQGYEYQCDHTAELFSLLMSGQHNIFPPSAWPRLTDLSLLNFDWTSVPLSELSRDSDCSTSEYYRAVRLFYQAIGQNLPSLTRLELTHPYNIQDDVYFWLFLTSPATSFPELPAQLWETGVLYNHRWLSKIRDPTEGRGEELPQLSLQTVLARQVALNPICHRLEHLQLHGLGERLPVLPAVLSWCPRLATFHLPEFDLLSDSLHSAASQHYADNFVLPCLSLLTRHGSISRPLGSSTDVYVLTLLLYVSIIF